jgi:hypothetical protein
MSQPNQTVDNPRETEEQSTIITITKPVKFLGNSNAVIGYDATYEYYDNNQKKYAGIRPYGLLSASLNVNTGSIYLSGSLLNIPEGYTGVVCFPQSPYQNGSQA